VKNAKKVKKLKDFFQQNSESIIYTQTSSSNKINQKRETKKEKPK